MILLTLRINTQCGDVRVSKSYCTAGALGEGRKQSIMHRQMLLLDVPKMTRKVSDLTLERVAAHKCWRHRAGGPAGDWQQNFGSPGI